MSLESPLLPRHFFEATFSGLSATTLESAFPATQLSSESFNGRSGIRISVTIRSNVNDAKINAKNFSRFDQVRVIDVADDREVPVPPHQHQINFPFAMGKQSALMTPTDIRDFLPSGDGPNRQLFIGQETEDPLVKWLCAVGAELSLFVRIAFVRISYLGNASHRNLGSQSELSSNFAVGPFVKRKLTKNLIFKRQCGEPVARLVATLQGLFEQGSLFNIGQKFDVRNELHGFKYRTNPMTVQETIVNQLSYQKDCSQ